jgi:hypothetical protein
MVYPSNTTTKDGAKKLKHFSKDQMANKHEKCSISVVSSEMQIKIISNQNGYYQENKK